MRTQDAKPHQAIERKSALLDKSFFQELCEQPDTHKRERLWDELYKRYQLVVPVPLIEECIAGSYPVEKRALPETHRIIESILIHQACWLEDILEIVFRELVLHEEIKKLPAIDSDIREAISQLSWNDPELDKWMFNRRVEARTVSTERKVMQQRLREQASHTTLSDEGELFQVLKAFFLHQMGETARRKTFLETLVASRMRARHPECSDDITHAISTYNLETFKDYPVTIKYINVTLAYLLAPVFILPGPSAQMPERFLREEPNNLCDAEYVASALICDRFITRDRQQARMCRVFKSCGLWGGEVIHIPAERNLEDAIPEVLI